MKINYLDIELPDLDIYDGIIITSNHAKQILPKGYSHIYSINKDAPTADALARKINHESPDKKRFLYIRGADIAFNMVGALENHNITELINYQAVAIDNLSKEAIHAFKNGDIAAITFFSKRTAEIFVKLAIHHDILDNMQGIKALCMSNSMVECLYSIFSDNIEVSNSPDTRIMAQMVDNIKIVKGINDE